MSLRIASLLVALAGTSTAWAQSWSVSGGSIASQGSVQTIPGGVLPFAGNTTLNPNPGMGPGVYTSFNRATLRNSIACGTGLARCIEKAEAGGWMRVDESPSDISIAFVGDVRVSHSCPIECCLVWDNRAEIDQYTLAIDLTIVGVPNGTPVDVAWSSDLLLSVFGRHESNLEDPIVVNPPSLDVTFDTGSAFQTDDLLAGTIPGVTDNPFNMTLPAQVLQQQDASGGSFTVAAGTPITIVFNAVDMSVIHVPEGGPLGPKPGCPIGWSDSDGAEFFGRIRLRLGTVIPPGIPGVVAPPPYQLANHDMEFSLDIGSDSELSEVVNPPPQQPLFDPGDMYVWKGPPLPPGGANGIRDDFAGLGQAGFITVPDPGNPLLPLLCVGGPPLVPGFLNVDGFDAIDFDLVQLFNTGPAPFPRFNSDTVFEPTHIYISAKDSGPRSYSQCDLPINSVSPGLRIYGETGNKDEIIELRANTPFGIQPGPMSTVALPLLDEIDLHPSLRANPDGFALEFDDDVNALDINWAAGYGRFWLFTVDHHASAGLDPGSIYQTSAAGNPQLAVPGPALGLLPNTAISAFSMAWVPSPVGDALAVLFSVPSDDPLTNPDESGGLKPDIIYVSFMDGAHREFATWPYGDDIDAIAVWHRSLSVVPVPCLGDIADDFGFTVAQGGGPDGVVDFGDFVALLGLIGPCPGGLPGCLGDIADDFGFTVAQGGGPDGVVDFGDFVALLGLIGPCP